jgi:hypothetical protein
MPLVSGGQHNNLKTPPRAAAAAPHVDHSR